MRPIICLLIAALIGAVSTAEAAQRPPKGADEQVATPIGPAIVVPDLSDADLDLWIGKSNAAVKLLNASLRARESWNRYLSWVDVRKGPTGKERIIYGLYSVSPSSVTDSVAAVRAATGEPPAVPDLDQALLELAAAFEAVVPILNEAEGYYERQDYKVDGMKEGRALHARLVPAMATFLAARDRLERRHAEVKAGLDGQELARIERKEGKSQRWHVRRVMIRAEAAVALAPRDPRRPGDLPAFYAAVDAYAAAVKEFDTFLLADKKSGVFDSQPRSLLGKLREIREQFEKKRVDAFKYSFDISGLVMEYNMMTSLSSSFRF